MISKCLCLLGAVALALSLPLDEKMDPTLHRGVDRATVLAPRANETYVGDTRIQHTAVPVGPSLVEGLNKGPGTPTVHDTYVRGGAMDKPVVEAYDATKQVVQDAGEKVREGYEAGKQKVADVAQGAKEVAVGVAEKTKETAQEVRDKGREKINDARNSVADSMRSGADTVEARPSPRP